MVRDDVVLDDDDASLYGKDDDELQACVVALFFLRRLAYLDDSLISLDTSHCERSNSAISNNVN